ncbi:MAG TPA: histidine phosphatase family protein [Rhodanobacteraceae bacterium]|jgi:probable phosphoglycerate mutase|nr:histidine phosphatase family protein [Rhodanobacteraceae bacterium]
MKTKFLMVRHATCAHIDDTLLGRTLDASLDANGERQAHMLAERLRNEAPLRVESSPRRRTLQTAHAIADALRCDVQVAPALDELDFGNWSGRTFEQLERERGWRRWNRNRDDARTPAGIDIRTVQRGIALHLAALAATYAGATLVLVTHAEIIRSLVLHCLRAPARDYARFALDPASITCFTFDAGGLHVGTVNEGVAP